MIEIGPTDEIPDRAFTAVGHGERDLAVMNRMLARLRRHVAEIDVSDGPRDDRFVDDAEHMIVLPDPSIVSSSDDLVAVGFFGQARADVDHRPIVELEERLVRRMPGTTGLVAYYNVHWPTRGWGNLVLFAGEAAKDGWGHDDLHHDAIERSARHYHSIRLHNGIVAGGLLGGRPVRLVRTKYLDFSTVPPWRCIRSLAP
jgi:hypothetical protein